MHIKIKCSGFLLHESKVHRKFQVTKNVLLLGSQVKCNFTFIVTFSHILHFPALVSLHAFPLRKGF